MKKDRKDHVLQIRVNADEKKRLESLGTIFDKSTSDIIRKALEQYFNRITDELGGFTKDTEELDKN